jgi:exonuclease VII large subunit
MMSLRDSRSILDAWAEDQMEQADAAAAAHEAQVSQDQACIDSQIQELLAVELERGLNVSSQSNTSNNSESLAKRRAELAREQDDLRKEISELQEKHTQRQEEIQGMNTRGVFVRSGYYYSNTFSFPMCIELKLVEKKERARADQASDMKQQLEEAKQTTVDDLTRGIVNYKFLGLDFEKAHDNRLK